MDVLPRPEVKEYNGYMLMKFTSKEEYRQDFLNGELFFNTSDYFSMCDDVGRGDADEGKTFIVNPENSNYISANLEKYGDKYYIVTRDNSDNPEEYKVGILSYSSSENRNRKVMSLYTVYLDFKGKKISDFSSKIKEEFGNFGILILDRREFFQRIIEALRENKSAKDAYMGFVEYLPEDKQQGLVNWNPFRKRDCFSYQNEFRITFITEDDRPLRLNLGCSLRDIAVPIDTDDLHEIYFEGEDLFYPLYP